MNFMNKFLLLLLFNSGSLFGSYELINSDNAESNTAFLFVHGLDGSKHQGLYYCNKYTNKDGILKPKTARPDMTQSCQLYSDLISLNFS